MFACAVCAAEPAPSLPAGVEALDRAQAEQERLKKMLESKPRAYEDKVMDASPLAPLPELGTSAAEGQEGLRTMLSETRIGAASSDSGLQLRRATELGQRIEYRRETLNHGDYALSADFRTSGGDSGASGGPLGYASKSSNGRLTLRNIGFPVTTKVFADTSLGDISSEVTNALARTYRLSLGTSTVRGAGIRVFDEHSDLRAGFGQRGTLAGGPYPGFEKSRGSLAWLGYSRRLSGNTFAGLQVTRANDVPSYSLDAAATGGSVDVNSIAASAGYGGDLLAVGSRKARITYLRSQVEGASARKSQGIFLEGGLRTEATRQEFGAYAAEPELRYGDYLLSSDNRGAYWRVDGTGMRLNWGFGVDLEEQNPDRDRTRLNRRSASVQVNATYQMDRDTQVGGNLSITRARHDSSAVLGGFGDGMRSGHASAFYQTRFFRWGRSRLRVTMRRNEMLVANAVAATGEEVEWEQDWITGRYETMRPELTTTLGFARDRSEGLKELEPTAGVSFRVWPDADWTVGGTLRYTARNGNLATSRGLSGTLDTEKTLQGGWVIGASLSLNQAVVEVPALGIGAPQVSRSNDKFASVYLRWEGAQGGGFQGAGVHAPGAVGAGSLGGIVFFDANRDGEQQLDENGVPNVEVVMDGRYRATTNRLGRFDFPLVGTGRHQLTLTLETVPLPWGAAPEQAVSSDVPLRGQATVRIPVVRVGD